MKVVGRLKRCFLFLVLVFSISALLSFCFMVKFKDRCVTQFSINSSETTQIDVNFPRTSEVIPFHFFNNRNVYSVSTNTVSTQTEEDDELISVAKEIAAKYLHASVSSFKYGQYRLLGHGVEFDLYFSMADAFDNKRISLFFPFGSPKGVFVHEGRRVPETINIILPLKGKAKALEAFADNIVKNIYPVDDRITLTVVYFRDASERHIKSILQKKFASIPELKWTLLLETASAFSRGQAIQTGASYVGQRSSDLLFFCDVDVIMRPDFLQRCRTNTVQSKQVYFPIVFSLYNPSLVYRFALRKESLEVADDNGFWRHFGYGMVCLYKGDFDAVGGIPDIRSWGGEDEALFDRFSKESNIKYIRTPDPDLLHMYHRKDCRNVSSYSKIGCLKSKIFSEGSQLHMGLALFKIYEDADFVSVLSSVLDETPYIVVVTLLVISFSFNLLLLICGLQLYWGRRSCII